MTYVCPSHGRQSDSAEREAEFGDGCCGFFGLFGHVLKVVLPNVLPVSVAGIFRGQHSVLWCSLLGSGTF